MIFSSRGIIQKAAEAAGQCDNGTVRETGFIGEERTTYTDSSFNGKGGEKGRSIDRLCGLLPRDCWFRI